MQGKLYSIISITLLLALLLSPVASFAASPHPLPYTAYRTVSVMDEPAAVERTANQQILSYWSEDFSGEVFPPPGWLVYNLDGGEPNWERVTDDYVSAPASAAHHFNVPPQISQVGWLITPPVILPNNGEVFFSFYEKTQRPQRYYKQELYLSTGDCNPLEGDFGLLLEVQGNGTWGQIEIDLSAFAGQTVCLGFLYEGNEASRWLIDDVLISAVIYDLSLAADVPAKTGMPSETVEYELTLTNLGTVEDTYQLFITGAVWEVSLSHTQVPLAAGDSVEVAVQVTVPGDAGDGDVDSALVTAASTGSPGLAAEALLTTTSVLSPVASFDPSTLFTVVGEEVAFTNTSTGTEPLTFLWDFGDDATSTDTNPVHTFEEEGEYTVSLTASNTYGTSTFELVISAGFVPVAAFTASHETAEVGEEVTFTNTSTGTEPLTFLWDFGDDATSTDTNPVHTFEEEGEYTVSLTASNTYGQSTFELVINVGYVPLAAFTASHETAEVGEEVTFTNTSTGTEPLTFLWDFGDDATSTDIHPVHVYNEEGEYTVSLTASNTHGTSTFELVISAGYAPTAAFSASHEVAVVGEVISFTNASNGTAPLQYAWDFGHGLGSSAVNPTKSYPQPGLYTVLLTVSNPYGEDQTSLEILVVPAAPVGADLELTLQVDPLPVRINQPVTITATITNHGPASATGVTASGEIPEFVSS
jgi:PKD repeat protein